MAGEGSEHRRSSTALALNVTQRIAAGLCLIAVFYLTRSEFNVASSETGGLASNLAIILILAGLVMATGPSYWKTALPMPERLSWPPRAVLWWVLLPSCTLLLATAPAHMLGFSPRWLIWIWFAGLCWLLFGIWRASSKHTPASSASPAWTSEYAWLWAALMVVLAFALRAWSLGTIPREVHGDETATAYRAMGFYGNPDRDWFGADILMNFLYAVAGFGMLIFGPNLTGSRTSDVLLGVASVVLLFDALRRLTTMRVALVASFLVVFSHIHIAYSRNGASYIQSAFVVAWLFALAARVWITPTYLNAVLLGVVAGVGIHTVPASVLSLPLLVLALGVALVLHPTRARTLVVPLTLAAVVCACVAAPFFAGIWQHRVGLSSRTSSINIFAPHVMANLKSELQTDSTLSVAVQQAWRGLTGFQDGRNTQPQYAAGRPLADAYTAAFIIPGAILALFGFRKLLAILTLLFTAGYLVAGLGMYHGMGFQRAVPAVVSGMVLAAIGLVQCSETVFAGRRRAFGWARDLVLVAVVIVCGFANLYIYFVQCRASVLFSDAASESMWVARRYAQDYRVHLADWPPPGIDDLRLIIEGIPVTWNTLPTPLEYVKTAAANGRDLFVLRTDETTERDVLLARFPDARVAIHRRHPAIGPALFLVFVGGPGPNKAVGDFTRPLDDPTSAWSRWSSELSDSLYRYVLAAYNASPE